MVDTKIAAVSALNIYKNKQFGGVGSESLLATSHSQKVKKFESVYTHYSQEALASHQRVAAAKAEESEMINAAMKEAEDSYQEMMEVHHVLEEAYQDLMKWRRKC